MSSYNPGHSISTSGGSRRMIRTDLSPSPPLSPIKSASAFSVSSSVASGRPSRLQMRKETVNMAGRNRQLTTSGPKARKPSRLPTMLAPSPSELYNTRSLFPPTSKSDAGGSMLGGFGPASVSPSGVATWSNISHLLNPKDELLMGLLSSQAMVESKESEILSAEEVDELKKEYSLLSTRIASLAKKLTLEMKIRDASQTIRVLHPGSPGSLSPNGPPQPHEQQILEAYQKVDEAQRELLRMTARQSEVTQKLLEHRAGILSFSLRNQERKSSGLLEEGDSEGSGITLINGDVSPTSTIAGGSRKSGKSRSNSLAAVAAANEQLMALEEKLMAARAEVDDLREEQQRTQGELELANERYEELKKKWDKDREETTRSMQEKEDDFLKASMDLDKARETLKTACRTHKISASMMSMDIKTYVTAIEGELESHQKARAEWEETRRVLEKASSDKQSAELDELRKERDEAKKEIRSLEEQLFNAGNTLATQVAAPLEESSSEDVARIFGILKPIWAVLPSVEARAQKIAAATAASGRPPRSPKAGGTPGASPSISLADLDVKSLKALYDPKIGYRSPTPGSGDFTLEDFTTRVQALIADDRALVERLLRFAQAHELLKNNAERAQKLATESSQGLETYQKQVKILEERNQLLGARQATLMDEIDDLNAALKRADEDLGRVTQEHQTMEEMVLAQAEQMNKTSSLSVEEVELLKKKLKDANEEIDRVQAAESMQRVALLDELNSLQQENGNLRNQLRARR